MIHFGERVLGEPGPDSGTVSKPIALANERLTNSRKLLRSIADHVLPRGTRVRVESPASEHGVTLARSTLLAIEHARMSCGIQDHFVTVVECIHRVEDVARVDGHPLHIVGGSLARQEPDSWFVRGIPEVRQTGAFHRCIEIEHARQVEDQHVPFGDCQIVDHWSTGKWNVDVAANTTVDANHQVLHLVAPAPVVRHDVQFARARVALRMGGERKGQRPVETRDSNRVQVVRQFHGRRTCLDDCKGSSGMPDYVGVGGKRRVVGRPIAWRRCSTLEIAYFLCANPTVSVPRGVPGVQSDAMHHAMTREPVVLGLVDASCRIRAVAKIAAGEFVGNGAGDP